MRGSRRSPKRRSLIRPEPPLAEAQIVDQAEAAFADEPGTAGNSGERGRERRFPRPRHDQRLAVPFRPQPLSECAMVA